MTVTDIATLILSIFLLMLGASRGFMNSLTGPFSMIVATVISIIYYQITKNVVVSLLIGLIGPILLNLFLKFLLKAWSATNSDKKPGFLSRLGGSVLTLIWGWVFIIFGLILVTVMPSRGATLTAIHHDVVRSKSYLIAKPWENVLFGSSARNVTTGTSNSFSRDEANSLAEDPRFRRILQDPEIQKEIDAHDIVKLMGNPKMMALVQQIMNDPAALKKVMSVYRNQAQLPGTKNP